MFENTNTFIIKVTKSCNLRCKYCYVKNKDAETGKFMSFEIFKTLIDRIIEDNEKRMIMNEEPQRISLIFHGGEPSLLDYNSYRKFLAYAHRNLTSHNIPYKFEMQTNGTLINNDHKDLVNLLKKYDVRLGFSYDGLLTSEASRGVPEKKWEELFSFLKENNIDKGLLMVINKHNYQSFIENMEYLKKHQQVESIKVNYVVDVLNAGNLEISGEDYFNYIAKPYFDNLIENPKDFPMLEESNFMSILDNHFNHYITGRFIQNNNKGICYIKYCGAGLTVMEISPDGGLDRCGRYSAPTDYSEVGTISKKEFLSLNVASKFIEILREKHKAILKKGCDICEAADICTYGCMAFTKDKTGEWGIEDIIHTFSRILWKYIMENESKLLRAYLLYKISKTNTGRLYWHLPRVTRIGDVESSYQKFVRMVEDAGMVCTPDRDFIYNDEKGKYTQNIIIEEVHD